MDYIAIQNSINSMGNATQPLNKDNQTTTNKIVIYNKGNTPFLGFYTLIDIIRPFDDRVLKNEGDLGVEALRLGGVSDLVFKTGETLGELAGAISSGDFKTFIEDEKLDKLVDSIVKLENSSDFKSAVENTTEALKSLTDTVATTVSDVLLGLTVKPQRNINPLKTIILPLPNDIPSDTVNIEWKEENLGLMGTLFNKRESDGKGSAKVIATKLVDKLYDKLLGKSPDNLLGNINSLLENAQRLRATQKGIRVGGDDDLVVFGGVKRRTVSLEWNFIPNSQDEMKSVLDIANNLKRYTNASNVANDYGTVYPAYIRLSVYLKEKLYYHIYEGVIESFEFTPVQGNNGLWREDGKPVEISLKLTIKERRRMYAEDYGYNGITDGKGEITLTNPKSSTLDRDTVKPINFYTEFK